MSSQTLWTKQQLEELVHALARDSARVYFTEHCLQRMEQRGISTIEVLQCLRRGRIVRVPIWNEHHRSYEFRMSEPVPRDIVCVVAAIAPVKAPDQLFAVTVWEI
ncbi:MAG TPA: hypothetical protein DIT18_02470 [Pseudomonas sp.]|jgi:hypothetical protein|nr:hypothetical protein [Pseudomonas sp.]